MSVGHCDSCERSVQSAKLLAKSRHVGVLVCDWFISRPVGVLSPQAEATRAGNRLMSDTNCKFTQLQSKHNRQRNAILKRGDLQIQKDIVLGQD